MSKTCDTCYKAVTKNGSVIFCRVFTSHTYLHKRYGCCFGWTDDPHWDKKVKLAVEEYKLTHQERLT